MPALPSRPLWVIAAAVLLAALPVDLRAAPNPVAINAIISLTGQQAFLGKEEAQTLGALEDTINKSGGIRGRPIHFVIHDDASDPKTGVQLASAVMAQQARVIIGPSLTAVCLAIGTIVANGPVEWCLSPGIHPKPGYVFSAMPSIEDSYAAAIRYFRLKGWKRVGLVIGTDASGQVAEKSIDDALHLAENNDVKLVEKEYFAPGDLSVAAQIARIKAANPAVVIAHGTGAPAGTLLREIAESGLSTPVFTSTANLTYAQMNAYGSFLPKELLFAGSPFLAPQQLSPGPVKTAVAQFFEAFKPLHARPDLGQASVWDAALILVDALKKLGPDATSEQLKEYMQSLRGWPGIFGRYDFVNSPQRGLDISDVVIVRWIADKGTWDGLSKPGGAPL